MRVTPLDHARNAWLDADARLRWLEQNRFAYVFRSWVGAADVAAYDQRIVAARAAKDQAFAEYKVLKATAPTIRPVKLTSQRAPVKLLTSPRPRPLSAAQQLQVHAALDAAAWRLSGIK